MEFNGKRQIFKYDRNTLDGVKWGKSRSEWTDELSPEAMPGSTAGVRTGRREKQSETQAPGGSSTGKRRPTGPKVEGLPEKDHKGGSQHPR